MNLKLFKKRLKSLYTNWSKRKQDLWGGADVLVISTSPSTLRSSNPISSKLFLWLLGYEFSDTIAIFTNKEIHFVCSNQLKASQLKTLEKSVEEAIRGIQLVIHVKGKSDNGDMIMDEILYVYRLQCRLKYLSYRVKIIKGVNEEDLENDKGIPLVLGHVVGEAPLSNLLCGSPKRDLFKIVDINTGLFKLVFSKEEQINKEILNEEERLSKVEEDQNKEILAEEEPIELVVWGFRRRSVQDDQGGLTIN
ncbi:hypothetical protein AQUCO_01800142v1 [Aquilegia coerulea]|uniref:FACT complex subunit n=1 Tax=Aquilegia coerulea TaxID=218851 RepID=A0A2G5DK61_AQUCA|nr:hypothetical protein AQUCO_01800142v1 [Aquilegia coerulea]